MTDVVIPETGFKLPSWSFSSRQQFKNCPKQYAEVRVYKRIKDVPGVEAQWGDRVHKAIEATVKTDKPMAPEFAPYQALADVVKTWPGTVRSEQQIALTYDLKQTEWYAPDVWVRGILDVTQVNGDAASVLDWKTGKVKPDSDQLKLFALLTFAIEPLVNRVKTAFVWIKHRKTTPAEFTRDQVDELWKPFREDYDQILWAHLTNSFPPRPSGLCNGWCPVTDCSFWRPKRK
jgi:hypothetical protein